MTNAGRCILHVDIDLYWELHCYCYNIKYMDGNCLIP